MDEHARLAMRLLDATIASGGSIAGIKQYCQIVEAGVAALHNTTTETARIADTSVRWKELFGGEDSASADWLRKLRITTLGAFQMLSGRDLLYVPNIGAKRLKQIEDFLALAGDLRLRDVGESFTKCAERVYGSIDRVPVTVLMIRFGYEPWHYTLIDRLNLATIGDLRRHATEADFVWQSWDERERSFLSMLYHAAQPENLAKKR